MSLDIGYMEVLILGGMQEEEDSNILIMINKNKKDR